MPKVKFLQDFQGKETREVFYKQGQEVELPDHVVSQLVKDGRAELVKNEPLTVEEFLTPEIHENVTNVETVVVEPETITDETGIEQPITHTEQAPKRSKRGRK